jgi:hypothetical protein
MTTLHKIRGRATEPRTARPNTRNRIAYAASDTATIGGLPNFRMDSRARCHQVDPDVMFPAHASETAAALKVCRPCPLKDECLSWSVQKPEHFGVWGGTTEKQRRPLIEARRVAQTAVAA